MTLPNERYRALQQGKKLLEDLLDPGKTPRVPSIVRNRASGVLRHYPSEWEFQELARNSPDLLNTEAWSPYGRQVVNNRG